jgi:6-phosphogluconolactonase
MFVSFNRHLVREYVSVRLRRAAVDRSTGSQPRHVGTLQPGAEVMRVLRPNLSSCGLCAALLLLGCSGSELSSPRDRTLDAGSLQDTPAPDAGGNAGGDAGRSPASPPNDEAGRGAAGGTAAGVASAGEAAPPMESLPDGGMSQDGALPEPPEPEPAEPSVVYGPMFVYAGGWDWGSTTYPFASFEFDLIAGTWRQIGEPTDLGANPSYIAKSPDQRTLYITNERDDSLGGLTVARVEANGALERLGHQPPADGGFVFASLDPATRFVLASSYNGASISVFPRRTDGTLGSAVATRTFPEGAKSHSILARGGFAWVANLALDSIAQLTFDDSTGQLADNPAAAAFVDRPDSGPRTIAAPPDPANPHLYVSHEFGSSISVMRVADTGTLAEQQTLSSVPLNFSGQNTGSHVQVHPNGNFLYVSNRGHDSIAVFAIAPDGSLSLLQHASTRGQTPRHFDIDASGQWLIVANQSSGSLAAFRIVSDGRLEPFGELATGLLEPTAVAVVRR